MKHLLKLHVGFGVLVLITPLLAPAQARELASLMQETSPLLLHSNSQGYLGVELTDVDNDKAQTLKLKEVRGALITLIDHDAPACQAGLKVNDVVVQLNGQNVESAEQLRRMLRELPAGRKVSLGISRDGNIQTLAVELADRRAMEHDIWNKLGNSGDDSSAPAGMGILSSGDTSLPGGFHMPFFGSSLNVGALLEPLTSQMAEYMGVPHGLMVKQVAHKSEADAAGLKAFDVILKVGPESIHTLADWERSLHANQGKPVQVTILRDKKQQTLTLQVDSKRKQGTLELKDIFPGENDSELAQLDLDDYLPSARLLQDSAADLKARAVDAEALAKQIETQAQALCDQARTDANTLMSQQKVEELRRQAEELKEKLNTQSFQIDAKQLQQMKQQMKQQVEQLRNSLKPQDFQIDQKQLDEMKRQMEEFRREFKTSDSPFNTTN